MLMRIPPRTPHQSFYEFKLNYKVTMKNKKSPDDKKISMVWQLGTDFATLFFWYLFSRAFLSIKFEGEILMRIPPRTPNQLFHEFKLNSKVTVKNKKSPDDKKISLVWQLGTDFTTFHQILLLGFLSGELDAIGLALRPALVAVLVGGHTPSEKVLCNGTIIRIWVAIVWKRRGSSTALKIIGPGD